MPGLLRDLHEALRFLTRLPLPGPPVQRGPTAAMGAFPLAGFVLGLALAAIDLALRLAGLPPGTCDALIVVALVLLSGGLHLDGLMDTCDGLFGGRTPEQRLLIMRDSRSGSFGVLGGACVLLLKLGLLGALHGEGRSAALLLVPMLGRWSLVLSAALFPPARPEGLGAAFRAGLTFRALATATGSAALLAYAVGGGAGTAALAAACLATWLLGRAIMTRIPGLTGDTYGALAELNEVVALLVLALEGVDAPRWLLP